MAAAFQRSVPTLVTSICLALLGILQVASSSTALAAPVLAVRSSDDAGLTLEFTLPPLQENSVVVNGESFQELSILGPSGEPETPTFTRLVAVPWGAEMRAEATVLEEEERNGYRPLTEETVAGISASRSANAEDAFSPSALVRTAEPAILAGMRVAPLVVQPVRYDPASGKTRIARRIQVRVDFSASARPATADLDERGDRPIPRSFVPILRALVINQEALRGREIRSGAWVVICPDDPAVTARLAPLVEWRRRQGWTVRLATTTETGTTNETILAWLRQAYRTWEIPPEYVVLAGDATPPFQIPTWFERFPERKARGITPTPSWTGTTCSPMSTWAGSRSTP